MGTKSEKDEEFQMGLEAMVPRGEPTGNSDINEIAKVGTAGGVAGNRQVSEGHVPTFQSRVQPWLLECFGAEVAGDREERNHRFLEEALELVQSLGCSRAAAHELVDYVYGRPAGDPPQEVGGVMVTLAALCLANDLDMHEAGETELTRVWGKIDKIRAKNATKPKHSPLPGKAPTETDDSEPYLDIRLGQGDWLSGSTMYRDEPAIVFRPAPVRGTPGAPLEGMSADSDLIAPDAIVMRISTPRALEQYFGLLQRAGWLMMRSAPSPMASLSFARFLAEEAHDGQTRKYTGEPYFNHVAEVSALCLVAGEPPEVVAAAYLHDVIEDTSITADDIAKTCGPKVAELVLEVTDVSRPSDGNRRARKAIDREHLSKASAGGKSIKLADMISNTKDIAKHDPNFARVYMREKRELLPVLKGGNAKLFQAAEFALAEYEKASTETL